MKKARGTVFNKTFPGKFFIVEGCDGSGKSTQLYLLKKWLESKGHYVFFTEWNSSDLLKKYTKKAKRKNLLTPTTFSLIHACDFADRYEKLILPHLRAGHIVLADRYIYTAYARDIARGCNPEWLKNLYHFAARPTIAFYFQAPLEVSLSRILTGRDEIKYHEAGMDLGLSKDPVESFKLFQGIIKKQYDRMAGPEGFVVMDATRTIEEQQAEMRKIVEKALASYHSPISSKQIMIPAIKAEAQHD